VKSIGARYIKSIHESSHFIEVSFYSLPHLLYWPKECPIDGFYQVCSETFDKTDWHYYQKPNTQILPEDIVLDIGTAEGLFALSIASRCKKLILIEPNNYFYSALQETFSPFSQKTQIYNVAVGNEEGEISFDQDSLSGKISNRDNKNLKRITKLDTLIGEEVLITYLKADLEGFELEMLKGAVNIIQKHRPTIAITCYHTENNPDEIIHFIKRAVPEYNHRVEGIFHVGGKPVMIHFWL
jgi:FkbM family methyltransferase